MFTLICTTLFGIEAITAEEIRAAGFSSEQITVTDGQVRVSVDSEEDMRQAVARLNFRLRTAERVLIQLASYPAKTFDELFDQALELPWETWLDRGFAIHVNGYSRKSELLVFRLASEHLKGDRTALGKKWQNGVGRLREDQHQV